MSKFTLACNPDQPRGLQFLQVMRKRGGRDGLALAHIRACHAFGLTANLLQNFIAARIRQGFGNTLYLEL